MLALLVTGHGHFASGLNSSLEFIAGAHSNVALVDFEQEHSFEQLKQNIHNALDKLTGYEGVLILSDLRGGSPFQAAVECKYERPQQIIEVVAGTNLPLLVACAMMSSVFETPSELADAMIAEGKNSMIRFEFSGK